MRFLNYIQEEYLTSLQRRGMPYAIYKNPSADDIGELKKEMRKSGSNFFDIRFIADMEKQKLYIWDASMALHFNITTYLERHGGLSKNVKEGNGIIKDSKIDSDLNSSIRKGYPGYQWLSKYFIV